MENQLSKPSMSQEENFIENNVLPEEIKVTIYYLYFFFLHIVFIFLFIYLFVYLFRLQFIFEYVALLLHNIFVSL